MCGGPSVSWTIATLAPMPSTAKTICPPITFSKYTMSVATSGLGS